MRIERPTTILALLTALNFLNYVDRYLVAAVSPAFQVDLKLSSFQTGLSISAFMVGYFVTSPLFGWLGDRARMPGAKPKPWATRTALIGFGVIVWSLATALSGLAQGATSLVLARIAVGIGEASYATVAPTIIDDLAPPARRNKWLAIFYLAIPVGSALGYLLGGFLEHNYGWRPAFFVAGGPGVLLALTVFFIAEPAVADVTAVAAMVEAKEKPKGAFAALSRAPIYVACVLGSCAYTFALGGFAAWAPKFLFDVHKLALDKADFGFGVVAVLAGILGTVIGGIVADRGLPKDVSDDVRVRRYMKFCAIATALAFPASVMVLYAGSPTAFFAWIFLCETALFASTSPMSAIVLAAVPRPLRTTAMAVSIFAMHALGDFPSPPLVGKLTDVFGSMRSAMLILPAAILVCAIVWGVGARMKVGAERTTLEA